MKNGEFKETQDAILVDEVEAKSKEEAYEKVIKSSQHKNKVFNNLIVKQVI
ncbi:hypothetical protein ISS05_04755 [Candidatus Woesearchaeota archaeon]|nr:hypothetical protein [Candidatus Woesearchaeota archaeon]